ncbi:hypothetical protein [Bacillus sp. P14.5]|uniref:hypothetical protein n=1 Tax=Bacillus sp. P14.5 TaxID=1983400 RepID=UPI000DEADBDB|nr:hypothetical protein [Bacillus sp. P14.5]
MKRFILALLILMFFLSFEGNIIAAGPQVDLKLKPDEFALTFLPFEKGEVAIIHLPDEVNYLINTGEINQSESLFSTLDKYGIKKINGILITDIKEFHKDAINSIIEKRGVEQIFTGVKLAPGFTGLDLPVRPLEKEKRST